MPAKIGEVIWLPNRDYAIWLTYAGDPNPIKVMFTMKEMEGARIKAQHNWRKMPRLIKKKAKK